MCVLSSRMVCTPETKCQALKTQNHRDHTQRRCVLSCWMLTTMHLHQHHHLMYGKEDGTVCKYSVVLALCCSPAAGAFPPSRKLGSEFRRQRCVV